MVHWGQQHSRTKRLNTLYHIQLQDTGQMMHFSIAVLDLSYIFFVPPTLCEIFYILLPHNAILFK